MEHGFQVPGFWRDLNYVLLLRTEVFHHFEQPKLELGLSYTFYRSYYEVHNIWKYPNSYSYRYDIDKSINIMSYCGIHSDYDRLVQTYGGIKFGYWSYRMWYSIQNDYDWSDYEHNDIRINHFAIGPRFGLSIGRKVQFILETQHLWLSPTKFTDRPMFLRSSSIQFGIRYNFKKKGKGSIE